MDHNQTSSLPYQAGQRLMVGFDGTDLNDELKYYIDTLLVGGVILFSRNLVAPDQVRRLCMLIQEHARLNGQPPLFIGIDQEGGQVARLKPPFTQFDGVPAMTHPDDARAFAEITARELLDVGINMNMAPVLDVLPAEGPSVMQQRAFGNDPHWVGRMGRTMIEYMQGNGLMAVAKHFPGIGRTVLDSHHDLPDLDTPVRDLKDRDLVPFQTAVQAGVDGIMMSHIRYRQLDERWPASLSPSIASDLLRGELGFDGLVLSDDLDMGAVAKHYRIPEIIHQSLSADVDLLLICHPGPKIQAAREEIVNRYRSSPVMRHKGEASLERIQRFKASYLKS
ncbi:MAG: beta-N-acetylhexosaminidase [Desulfosarcinaceae bacterium]